MPGSLRSERRRCLNQIYDAMMEPLSWSRTRLERYDLTGRSAATIRKGHIEYLTKASLWPPPSDFLGSKLDKIYEDVQAIAHQETGLDARVNSYLCRPVRCICNKQDNEFHEADGMFTMSSNLCLDCTTGAVNGLDECRTHHFYSRTSRLKDYDSSEEISEGGEEDSDQEAFNIPKGGQEDYEEDEDEDDNDDTDEDMDI